MMMGAQAAMPMLSKIDDGCQQIVYGSDAGSRRCHLEEQDTLTVSTAREFGRVLPASGS